MELKKIEINIFEYPKDVKRIQQVLRDRGYDASLFECEMLWSKYSDSMAAGWMILPDSDNEVFDCISYYIEN